MASLESFNSLPPIASPLKLLDSPSIDDSISVTSDRSSISNSMNDSLTYGKTSIDSPDIERSGNDDNEAVVSIISSPTSPDKPIKKSRPPFFKARTIATTHLFDSFDNDMTRILRCLENDLRQYSLEPNKSDSIISSIDSQLADIRLMISCEKGCSLLENYSIHDDKLTNSRTSKTILNQFDMSILQILLNQYVKANIILGMETGKK